MGAWPTGTLTILFTDIEGSTALLRRLPDQYPALLADHIAMLTDAIEAHGGVRVNIEGDGLFAVFPDAVEAVSACAEAQRALQGHQWPDGGRVRVRMGLHTGEAAVHDGDYVGLAVHQAARVATVAHGEQVVCSSATADAVAGRLDDEISLAALGAFAVRDFDRPEHLFQVRAPGLAARFPMVRARPAVAHNLPTIRTGFVGRERELGEVSKLLAVHRLVTIAGAGGVGKTRLSFELARQDAASYLDGAAVVLLASVTADRVLSAVADAVGIREEAGQPLRDTLAAALARRRMLLVLDNCEHVVGVVAELLDAVLDHADDLAVVATSRRPLEIPGEVVYQLGPLEPPGAGEPTEALLQNEAVRLFVERAQAAVNGFGLDHENGAIVADICRRVDGLPLAIELAAARVRSLPLNALAARLADTPSILTTGPRSAEARQRTVTALVDWSYQLLSPDEQLLFRRLSVFRGGFDLTAVEEVCSAPPLAGPDVLDTLDALVQHSLVMVGDGDRYRMLVVVRDVAAAHLAELDEEAPTRDRHLDHFATLAADKREGWWARVAPDLDNIRSALTWGLTDGGSVATARQLLLDVSAFLRRRGLSPELAQWCERVPPSDDVLASTAVELMRLSVVAPGELVARGPEIEGRVRDADDPTLWLIFHQRMLDAAEAVGQFATAREHAEAALAAAAEAADPFEVVRLLYKLAWTAYRMGNLEDARELAGRGSRQAAAIADTEAMADFEYVLAVLAATVGDAAGTAEHARAAVAVYEEMGSIALVQVWNVQAAMHFLAGELPAAVLAYEETVAASRRAGTRAMEAIATANLAQALTCLGRYDEAEAALQDGERVAGEIGHLFVQHLLACFAGIVAYARGDLDEAIRRSRREVELAEAIGSPEARARTTQTTAELALARGDAAEAVRLATTGLADHPSSEQGDATALLAAAHAVAGDADAARRHAIAALQAPRPYAATLPQLAVWLAVALGGEDAAVLVPAAKAAAAHMHLVLPVPILERLDLLTTSLHAALGGERCEALALEATHVPLAEVLDRLQARLAPDEGGSR